MKKYRFKDGLLIRGDCLKVLPKMKSGSVDLVFADPPFNIGYDYDTITDDKPPIEYVAWTMQWVEECVRILKPTGSMFVAIGDEYAAEMKKVLDRHMYMRNWIIWHYTFGVYCTHKFGRDHAHILYYCKNPKQRTFNDRAIRIPSARQTTYKDARANSDGRIPGDVWTYSRICGTFKERTGHPCQMPVAILDRIIRTATQRGERVLDPFAGSGTSLVSARQNGRQFIGVELSRRYASAIASRLSHIECGA